MNNNILNIKVLTLILMSVTFASSIDCMDLSMQVCNGENCKGSSIRKSSEILANITSPSSNHIKTKISEVSSNKEDKNQKSSSVDSSTSNIEKIIFRYLKNHLSVNKLEKCLGLGFCFRDYLSNTKNASDSVNNGKINNPTRFLCDNSVKYSELEIGVNATGCLKGYSNPYYINMIKGLELIDKNFGKCTEIGFCFKDKYLPCDKDSKNSEFIFGVNFTDCLV